MAKEILAVSSRSSNPVSHLAYLINAALEARSSHSDSFSTDYKQQLRTLVRAIALQFSRRPRNFLFYFIIFRLSIFPVK